MNQVTFSEPATKDEELAAVGKEISKTPRTDKACETGRSSVVVQLARQLETELAAESIKKPMEKLSSKLEEAFYASGISKIYHGLPKDVERLETELAELKRQLSEGPVCGNCEHKLARKFLEKQIADREPNIPIRAALAASFYKAVCDEEAGTIADAALELGIEMREYDYRTHWPIIAAKRCYRIADAFLAESAKERDGE